RVSESVQSVRVRRAVGLSRRPVASRARARARVSNQLFSPRQSPVRSSRARAALCLSRSARLVRLSVRPSGRSHVAQNRGHRVEFRETGLVVRRTHTHVCTYAHTVVSAASRCVGRRP
ncbi:hypothetical protein DBV15_03815, partial [Temnothorax longispinosus]